MKKLRLFALGVLSSGLLLTSCQKDEDEAVGPILTINETTTGIDNDGVVTVSPDADLSFTWDARKGDADLQDFEIYIDNNSINNTTTKGNPIPYENIAAAENTTYTDGVELQASASEGTTTIRFVVTDEDGLTASQTVTVRVESSTGAMLTSAAAFQWQRDGGDSAVGLEPFGLAWASNTSTSAIVKKDEAVKLVKLSATAWAATTVAELNGFIESASDIGDYRGISAVDPNKTYVDEYLGVDYNGALFILKINNSTSVGNGSGGTLITVDGMFKTEQ